LAAANTDSATAIAIDSGYVVIAGGAASADFPVTQDAFQTDCLACRNFSSLNRNFQAPGNAFVSEFQF
jgi:hypothetical protein